MLLAIAAGDPDARDALQAFIDVGVADPSQRIRIHNANTADGFPEGLLGLGCGDDDFIQFTSDCVIAGQKQDKRELNEV